MGQPSVHLTQGAKRARGLKHGQELAPSPLRLQWICVGRGCEVWCSYPAENTFLQQWWIQYPALPPRCSLGAHSQLSQSPSGPFLKVEIGGELSSGLLLGAVGLCPPKNK